MVVDGIDFIWASASQDRSSPENMILEFLNMTGIKIGTIRFDGAKEFGKSVSFQNFCNERGIIMEPVAEYTHVQNAKSENAVRISKEHVRCLLRASNLPRTFWPYALRHFLRLRAYWPTDNGNRCAWERLDAAYPNNKLRHTLSKDLHVFGSYVTGHLPRAHPFVADTTHDDRAVEGVWLGNDLCTPNFWMFSFKHKKVMKMSDPKHFDTILPFLQPTDVPHKIDLTVADIAKMHKDAGQDIDFLHTTSTIQTRSRAPALNADQIPSLSYPTDSGEHSANSGEIAAESLDMGVEVNNDPPLDTAPTLQDHRRFKDAKDVPPDATIQFLKPSMLGKILVHHRHVLSLPSTFLNEPDDVDGEVKMIAAKAYSIKNFWYVDYEVVAPDAKRLQYQGRIWQVPVMRGAAKSTNHCANVIDMLKQIYDKPSTLADIGITNVRNAKIYKLVAGLATTVTQNDTKRKQLETQVADLRSLERINTTITNIQEQEYTKQKQEKDLKSTAGPMYQQIIDTFPPNSDSIWDEIDLLEGDPPHRGAALRNLKFKPFWLAAEEAEWAGLWEKGVFKRWNKSDLLKNDRVFTSRYVYKLKRNAKTGAAYRFKARMCVRGFEMVKGLDYEDNFSPTPGISIARLMVSIAAANDLELHSVDIEQAFVQADKLKEGANGRYFITPPPGSPDAGDKSIVYEVLKPLYGNPSSPRALHKTMDAYFRSEGFDTIGFEESVWRRPAGGKYAEDIFISAHVDDCLIACKSADIMATFKRELLTRFVGTDEGEVTQYLGCEVIRDRTARTAKLVQAGYAERVLRTFGMWDCKPIHTPLDANSRLTKGDCPEVVDPILHRRYRSITGCLSYLVNMTRPDLAFAYSQLSKFVQYPGVKHLEAAERVLQYVRATYDQGITYFDPGSAMKNKLVGWVDSDFGSDVDSRKSMTGFLMSLNGGPISWKSSRQGGVTLSSSEAEFVAASQAGQEVVYLRALLRGFGYPQVGATEIWEDNASCIMMSENPTNRDRSRHVDVKVHFLRDLVRDGHVKLLKCAGTQNVSDALTKSLPRPAFEKHREYMIGTRVPFSAFYAGTVNLSRPTMAYAIKLPTPFYSKKDLAAYCAGG